MRDQQSQSGNQPSLYSQVIDRIIAELEQGIVPWVRPWGSGESGAGLGLPRNARTAKAYSDINIYAKIENPPGQRIERFFVDGEALDCDRTYTVAYVTMQAVPQHFRRNHRGLDLSAIGALERYLARHVGVSPALRGTVTAV